MLLFVIFKIVTMKFESVNGVVIIGLVNTGVVFLKSKCCCCNLKVRRCCC